MINLKPLIVGAPFGNYPRLISWLTKSDFTPTVGTYTLNKRGIFTKPYGGRYLRALLTIRHKYGTWFNRLGLKNPGILSYNGAASDKIINIYGWNMDEWKALLKAVKNINPLAVELNLSCPNVDKPPFTKDLFKLALDSGIETIVKVSPVNYQPVVEMAYHCGIRAFHATNSYPTSKGGMSGKALMPFALEAVRYIRHFPGVKIIGGGGITGPSDVVHFQLAGAKHIAIASMLLSPFNWRKVKDIEEEAKWPHLKLSKI